MLLRYQLKGLMPEVPVMRVFAKCHLTACKAEVAEDELVENQDIDNTFGHF